MMIKSQKTLAMKKSFSIIELAVVTGILSLLFLATTLFLLSIIQQDNKSSIENEIRNEGNYIINQLAQDIRASKSHTLGAGSIISLYSDVSQSPATLFASYTINANNLLRNGVILNSTKTWVRSCSDCKCTSPSLGLIIEVPTAVGQNYIFKNINLGLTQARANPRSDFCGIIKINTKVTTRKYY